MVTGITGIPQMGGTDNVLIHLACPHHNADNEDSEDACLLYWLV